MDCKNCDYKRKYFRLKRKMRTKGRFFKYMVSGVIIHGTICVTMSYILAWTEHTQVVEGVSSTIITEIIAPVIMYGVTKTIENIFQKNKLSFSEPINEESGGLG